MRLVCSEMLRLSLRTHSRLTSGPVRTAHWLPITLSPERSSRSLSSLPVFLCPQIWLSVHSSVCPSIHSSISPSVHPAARPSTLTTSQPRSRLALTVSILKSRALPRLSYFQLQCSTVFSTVFSSLPTWLLSLDKALHLSKPRFLHL